MSKARYLTSMLIYPVFIPQKGCPFRCIYCDQKQFVSVNNIPFERISTQLDQFNLNHINTDKQIAFYGGTFTGLHPEEREDYYRLVEPYLSSKTTIRISTRPDYIDQTIVDWCLNHHIKTIELGIQDFSDSVLTASMRGYSQKQAVDACFMIKQAGLELGVQLMPGLPKSSSDTIQESMECLQRIKPDFLRLYPLIVLSNTPIWEEWEAGNYTPLSLEEAINICVEYKLVTDKIGIEIIKFGIPSLAKGSKHYGPYHPAFGELVKGEMLIRKIIQGYKPEHIIHIAKKDISMLTGHRGYNLIKLLEKLGKCSLEIVPDSNLNKGEISYSAQ